MVELVIWMSKVHYYLGFSSRAYELILIPKLSFRSRDHL